MVTFEKLPLPYMVIKSVVSILCDSTNSLSFAVARQLCDFRWDDGYAVVAQVQHLQTRQLCDFRWYDGYAVFA
jgi:hypothetical protein